MNLTIQLHPYAQSFMCVVLPPRCFHVRMAVFVGAHCTSPYDLSSKNKRYIDGVRFMAVRFSATRIYDGHCKLQHRNLPNEGRP
jgi:hypothetical protein